MTGQANRGCKIVKKMVEDGVITRYRLAKEMGVSINSVQSWYEGRYFSEDVRLPRLLEVRERYMKLKSMGVYSGMFH